jgi:PHD/YefM family antitoxin component YafN of YafNO toxin-antitoxin module
MHDLAPALSPWHVASAEQSELVALTGNTKEAIVLVSAAESGPPPR